MSRSTFTKQPVVFGSVIKSFQHMFKTSRTSNSICLKKIQTIPLSDLRNLKVLIIIGPQELPGPYRAVATKDDEGFVWFLIGSHDLVYDSLKR